jgi:hypothetical protein
MIRYSAVIDLILVRQGETTVTVMLVVTRVVTETIVVTVGKKEEVHEDSVGEIVGSGPQDFGTLMDGIQIVIPLTFN